MRKSSPFFSAETGTSDGGGVEVSRRADRCITTKEDAGGHSEGTRRHVLALGKKDSGYVNQERIKTCVIVNV